LWVIQSDHPKAFNARFGYETREYLLAPLDRDGMAEFATQVRDGELSAIEAFERKGGAISQRRKDPSIADPAPAASAASPNFEASSRFGG
jgi:hypothetical protein